MKTTDKDNKEDIYLLWDGEKIYDGQFVSALVMDKQIKKAQLRIVKRITNIRQPISIYIVGKQEDNPGVVIRGGSPVNCNCTGMLHWYLTKIKNHAVIDKDHKLRKVYKVKLLDYPDSSDDYKIF